MSAYEHALDTIFGRVNFERQPRFDYSATALNLERMQTLLDRLGNPHRQYHIVHVAGSKGKGSVCAFTEAILRAAGYRTGLYTSPHLHTFRERMRVDGRLIGRDALVAQVDACQDAVASLPGVTTFELITALAFSHFAQQGIEWAVVEVGLGGRLDATNVVVPDVSVISSLSYEHTSILGETLAQIAREKAGIIKPGVPVVAAPQPVEALDVIRTISLARSAPLTVLGENWSWQDRQQNWDHQTFDLETVAASSRPPVALHDLKIGLLGEHQVINAAASVATVYTLITRGVVIPESAVRQGLAATWWPARFEFLAAPGHGTGQEATIIADGAHNADSAARLAQLLAVQHARQPDGRVTIILGSSGDKDVTGILHALLPRCDHLICTQAHHPRALDTHQLAAMAHTLAPDLPISAVPGVAAAMEVAVRSARAPDIVCLTGSLFVAAEGREAWAAQHPEHFRTDDWVFEAEPLNL